MAKTNCTSIETFVKFPRSNLVREFRSIRAVARMLSGNGTASGGLRRRIDEAAMNSLTGRGNDVVRNNRIVG
jgi:hypothetical protein